MASTAADVKIRRMELKAARHAQEIALARQVVASPLVQLIGTVALTEALEGAGILSSRWAGAVEGGVITMVGLQALKDYGVIGAGVVGAGLGIGALESDSTLAQAGGQLQTGIYGLKALLGLI